MPERQQVNFSLRPGELEALDQIAVRWGVTRTDALRRLVYEEAGDVSGFISKLRESTNGGGTLAVVVEGGEVAELKLDGLDVSDRANGVLVGGGDGRADRLELRLEDPEGPGSVLLATLPARSSAVVTVEVSLADLLG